MGNRELDAQVAIEVMGWTGYRQGEDFDYLDNRPVRRWCPTWRYDDVEAVRAEIERRGLARQFINHLYSELIDEGLDNSQNSGAWAILNATPEAQCLAARAAVKAAKP